ncbi:MAG: DUF1028 domain-containing protein, partial [Thermoplasmata archaeon]|nr:DUF1028 domain-containing protein [Thermoplasmata archaeon]
MVSPRFGTFSIVAADPATGEWGVAVQSRFISVGAVVPWAVSRVGALATQALANVRYGPDGIDLLRRGQGADAVVEKLTKGDPKREQRQVGVVDAKGHAAAFTGKECFDWAGHVVGEGYTCQGNILFSRAVVEGMARAYESTPGDLPERLLAALAAGQREGGDRRGMQSAALLVVREKGGYDEGSDRWVDVRVDDHPTPIEELKRVFKIYDLTLLNREDPNGLVPLTGDVARSVQQELELLGFYTGRLTATWDEPTAKAFAKFLGENNFENKARDDAMAWPSVLHYLDERARAESARRTTTAPIVTDALSRGPGAAPKAAPAAPPQGEPPSPPKSGSKPKGRR